MNSPNRPVLRHLSACGLAFALGLAVVSGHAANSVQLHNASGAGLANYPLQIGRAFLPGEIAADPGVSIAGTPVPSQAEVTQRYPDGSAKFTVISTVVPSVSAGATVDLTFSSTTTSTTTTSISDLLALFPEFDAKINLTQTGVVKTVSARTMLLNGHATWLARGPIRYELLVADHVGRTYDLGFDAYKPLRPVFYVAFWPSLGKVRVRFVMENPNLDALEQVAYDVTLTTGKTNPTMVYSKTGVSHWFGSRWSKIFWIGGTPESKVNVDSDLAHLAATKFIPNYDPTNTPSEAYIANEWSYWQTRARDLYDFGFWTPYMPATGGRGDIGPIPSWTELWLSSGDWRTREMALTSADLAGAWPLHFREHNPALFFDRERTVAAPGYPISLTAHPDLWFPNNNGEYPGMISGAQRSPSWVPDGAHQPDPFSVPYLLTGDSFYLESMQLWAAAQAISYAPGQYGRGRSGYAGIQDQLRGNAWVLRNRVLAAQLSPDGSLMRRYFTQLTEDAIAFWLGERGIDSTLFNSHPNRVWAATNYPMVWSPLRYFERMRPGGHETSPWMEWYFLLELGFVRDLGVPVDPLLAEYSKLLIGQLTASSFDPRYTGAYRQLASTDADVWIADFPSLNAYNLAHRTSMMADAITSFTTGDPSYPIATASAGSFLTQYPNGQAAWAWLKSNVYDVKTTQLAGEYRRWKILPRAIVIIPSDAIITIMVE